MWLKGMKNVRDYVRSEWAKEKGAFIEAPLQWTEVKKTKTAANKKLASKYKKL